MATYRTAIIACGTIARVHARGWQGVAGQPVSIGACADTHPDARREFGDFFGVPDSKNSWYAEANGSFEISTGFSIIGHLGYQKLKGNAKVIEIGSTSLNDSITDWKIGVTYDLSGFLLGAAYVGTNRDLTGGTAALTNRNISNDTVVLSVSKSF